jgi:hypothetical protein
MKKSNKESTSSKRGISPHSKATSESPKPQSSSSSFYSSNSDDEEKKEKQEVKSPPENKKSLFSKPQNNQ